VQAYCGLVYRSSWKCLILTEDVLGVSGLASYPLVGIYKEMRNIKLADDDECPADLVQQLGEAEYASATASDKLYIVRVWSQTSMPLRLV
jgi:hypothetical protein